MTDPVSEPDLTPLEILARQNDAIEELLTTVELLQAQVEELRRRVQALEGVPWPEQEPDPD
jgi:FtsZ-binding cell division protein ZapB